MNQNTLRLLYYNKTNNQSVRLVLNLDVVGLLSIILSRISKNWPHALTSPSLENPGKTSQRDGDPPEGFAMRCFRKGTVLSGRTIGED